MKTKIALFVEHTRRVGYMDFQEHPSNRSRYAAENILCCPYKVPLINGRHNQTSTVFRAVRR